MSRALFLPGIRGNTLNEASSRQARNSYLLLDEERFTLACLPNRHLLLVNNYVRRTAQLTLHTHLFLRTKRTKLLVF